MLRAVTENRLANYFSLYKECVSDTGSNRKQLEDLPV